MLKKLLIGGYTYTGESRGIYVAELDDETGMLREVSACLDCENPSYLLQNGEMVYAVHELMDRGCIASYRLQGNTLSKVQCMDMPGGLMCHLCLWPGGKYLSAVNYWTGSLAVCPIDTSGAAGAPVILFQYTGSGPNAQRQEGPHAHFSGIDPAKRWLLATDLGSDRIYVYTLSAETGTLQPGALMPYVQTPPGTGPRHFTFRKDGQRIYVSCELSNEVLVYDFCMETGEMTLRQQITTLPDGYLGENLAADIHCSLDERYLYVSNRGHDSIAVFAIAQDGSLKLEGHCSCGGSGPRSFTLIKDFVLVANQGCGEVSVLRIGRNGLLGDSLSKLEVPQASYILLLKEHPEESTGGMIHE